MKVDDEYEEDQELNKSSDKMEAEESAPEPEPVVESNGRKVVEVTKAVSEQDKKGILSSAAVLVRISQKNIFLYSSVYFFYRLQRSS